MPCMAKTKNETFDFVCPLDKLGRVAKKGSPVALCGFTSTGWPSKAAAKKRGAEHEAEHATGEAMPELVDHLQGSD